jgi:hypothetical protein
MESGIRFLPSARTRRPRRAFCLPSPRRLRLLGRPAPPAAGQGLAAAVQKLFEPHRVNTSLPPESDSGQYASPGQFCRAPVTDAQQVRSFLQRE